MKVNMELQTKVVRVTPLLARKWLEHNTINRPLRRSVVDGYLSMYARGEHRLTHQGIAFSETGELLDGQHRLTAISELPETFAVDMMVTRGLSTAAFEAIDLGLKRTHADVLRRPAGLAAVARFLAVLNDQRHSAITPQSLIPYVEGIERYYDALIGFCPKNTKTWSSAAVRAAAILQIMSGSDKDYVSITYYALNHAEFDSMSHVAQALFRQQVKGLIRPHGMDMFCRAFKAFDNRNQNLNTIQISDTSTLVTKARETVLSKVLGQKKAPTSGAKKVNVPNSKRSVAT